MKVLVTGANGYLGRSIYRRLVREAEVFSLGTNTGNFIVDLAKGSIAIPYMDVIVHAAGMAHKVPKSKTHEQAFYDINYKGTLNLLNGIKRAPKSFVFISTVAVYGKDSGELITEAEPLLGTSPYAMSKIMAERLVIEWCSKNQVICTILRLPLVVGENPPGNLGDMMRAIRFGYYFNVGGGKARRSMVLANDVADFVLTVSKIGGIYNLTDGYHPNFFELSRALTKNVGRRIVINIPFKVAKILAIFGDNFGKKFPLNSNKLKKMTLSLTFDDSVARKKIGWRPQQVLDYYQNK